MLRSPRSGGESHTYTLLSDWELVRRVPVNFCIFVIRLRHNVFRYFSGADYDTGYGLATKALSARKRWEPMGTAK
jgi:hypothetical protein